LFSAIVVPPELTELAPIHHLSASTKPQDGCARAASCYSIAPPWASRASSILTFPRHPRTPSLDMATVDLPPSVRIWPAPFFHEELERLAQLSDSSFLAIWWLVAVHPATLSAMAATPWSTARLELPPLPLLRHRTMVKSHGARAAPRSAPSRLPHRMPSSMPPPPVRSYRLSSTRLPRAPLFSWLCSAGRPPFTDAQGAQHTTRGLPLSCRRVCRLAPRGAVTAPCTPYHAGWHGLARPNSPLGQVHRSTQLFRPVTHSRPPPREGRGRGPDFGPVLCINFLFLNSIISLNIHRNYSKF
jgi:hypothetical protein